MIPNIFSLLGESIVGKHIAKGIIFSNSPKKFHPNGSRIQVLQEKRATSELGKAQRNKKLIDYIEQSISRMDEDVSALKDEEKKSWEMLNQYFYSVLKK